MSSPREFVDDQGFGPTGFFETVHVDTQVDGEQDCKRVLMLAELISQVKTNKEAGDTRVGINERAEEVRGAIDAVVAKCANGDEELAVRLRKKLERHEHHFRRVDCDQVGLDVTLLREEDGGLSEDAAKELEEKLLTILGKDRLLIGECLSQKEQSAVDTPSIQSFY